VPANVPYGKSVDAESVILAVVASEAVIWNTVAGVAAALLPGAVLRLPVLRAVALPGSLLLVRLSWTPLLCRLVVLLLALYSVLILSHSCLLLLFREVILSLLLLMSLLIFLPLGNLLLVFIGLVLLLLSLFLLPRLCLLLFRVVPMLFFLFLLPLGLLPLFRFCGIVLLLPFRLSLLLRFRRFRLFFLLLRFPLSCASRKADSQQQKERRRLNDSHSFHGVTSVVSTSGPSFTALPLPPALCLPRNIACGTWPVGPSRYANSRKRMKDSEYVQEPKHYADTNYSVEYGFDTSGYGDETVWCENSMNRFNSTNGRTVYHPEFVKVSFDIARHS